MAANEVGNVTPAVANYWAQDAAGASVTYHDGANATLAPMHTGSIGNTGGSQGHSNMQPSLVLNWCIALRGIYPSRS
jgi:microcystin-dependent protein